MIKIEFLGDYEYEVTFDDNKVSHMTLDELVVLLRTYEGEQDE